MQKFTSLFATALGVVALTLPAGATTVTVFATAPAGYTPTTFLAGNSTSGPGSWNFGGSSVTANATFGSPITCLDPLSSSGTTAYFACAEANSTITATFAAGITGLDVLWGSPDAYNTITFYTGPNGTGTSESFVPGVAPLIAATPPLAASVLFEASAGVVWDSVSFSSSYDSFELGSIGTLAASSVATPEPSSVALLFAGFIALVAGVYRRRKLA